MRTQQPVFSAFGITLRNSTCTRSSQYFCMSVREPVNEIQKQINGNEVLFLINSAIQYTILSFAVLAVQGKGRLAWDTSPSSTRISARDP